MHAELQAWLDEYRVHHKFDADKWVNNKISQLNMYMKTHGLENCVVGVSGGVDSAVTLGLLKLASKVDGSTIKRILAISQPIHSSDWAYTRALECATFFGTEFYSIDQTDIHNQLSRLVESQLGQVGSEFAKGQLRSYMRTPVNYYISQMVGKCVVVGTGNADEDGYLAYFCKAGDGVFDLQLISDLHKSEVFKVGASISVPKCILEAPPSADLWEGHTDEQELGFSYDFVELYTGLFVGNPLTQKEHDLKYSRINLDSLSITARSEFDELAAKVDSIHARNKHKLVSAASLLL